jgi:hypothetical protein
LPEAKLPSAKGWRKRIDACRTERKKLVDGVWKDNVNYRKGKPFTTDSESDRVAVPIDWSFTKAKVANLYSQTPLVRLTPKNPTYAPAVPVFAKELNEVLQREAKVAVAIEEALADAVNAAGISAVMVGYRATFEDVEVPAVDISTLPPAQAQMLLASKQIPMQAVKRPVSEQFYAERISPSHLIWDVTFQGSDFDDAPFIGHDGKMTWAQAVREFGLTEDQREDATGGDKQDSLNEDADDQDSSEDEVSYTQIFYKAHVYDAEELYFERLRRIVFVDGIKKPVIHEDFKWQEIDEQTGSYIGVCKFPIRVLTLTYISDNAIPPSDSEVGRPQVDETMRSRSQMILQRDRNVPIRTYDPTRVDPMVAANLQKGIWNGFIPVQGNQTNPGIAELSRATYPREDWEFDRVTRADLQEAWQVGANQSGQFNPGERSAEEAAIIQQNFATRVGAERARVAKFFCGIAEVMAGLMQMFYDKPNEEPLIGEQGIARIEKVWDRSKVQGAKFVFSITQDSTVLLDSSQRVAQLMQFINLTGKSGYVNVAPIIAEVATLSGLDPAEVMTQPNPPSPENPNISLRLSGTEDLMNPIAIAMLLKSGQAPSAEEIAAAKLLLQDAMQPPAPPAPPAPQPMQGMGGPQMPQGPPEEWGPMGRVTKRVDELGG